MKIQIDKLAEPICIIKPVTVAGYRRYIPLNKTELIASVAENSGLSKKDAEKAVNSLIDSVVCALKKGEKVQLVGFGNFEVRERAARNGINPLTKQPMQFPATKVPVFKAGKTLKDSVK